jgi:hypothetical protein
MPTAGVSVDLGRIPSLARLVSAAGFRGAADAAAGAADEAHASGGQLERWRAG